MKKIRIKEAELSDLNDIIEIEAVSYGPHHWSYEAFEAEFKNNLARYTCAVNENGRVLGYIGLWCIVDEAHITTLAVHPDFRKQNVAKSLILDMFDFCYKEKIKYVTLEVRVSNIPAQKLYEKFGFLSLGMRKQYYQDNGEDAIIMWTKNIFDKNNRDIILNIKNELESVV